MLINYNYNLYSARKVLRVPTEGAITKEGIVYSANQIHPEPLHNPTVDMRGCAFYLLIYMQQVYNETIMKEEVLYLKKEI